jgi:hypothetical protein
MKDGKPLLSFLANYKSSGLYYKVSKLSDVVCYNYYFFLVTLIISKYINMLRTRKLKYI